MVLANLEVADKLGVASQFGAMAIGDFDEDGRVDLATGSSAAEVRILLGAGDGTLTVGR